MDGIKIQELSRNAINLFSETLKAFSTSASEVIRERSKFVPTKFVDENKKIRIVFVGQYSAGKSSFLNRITGADNLLPTGIEPVSMVATYLYCSKNTKDIIVKGVNLKNAIVLLDKDVLQSIQHESKSKIYLASVLNKLFVELPADELDGFVFIDTPGYNNSDKKNAANSTTDE